jgi:hypothetical protein
MAQPEMDGVDVVEADGQLGSTHLQPTFNSPWKWLQRKVNSLQPGITRGNIFLVMIDCERYEICESGLGEQARHNAPSRRPIEWGVRNAELRTLFGTGRLPGRRRKSGVIRLNPG